jgi:hypothetical protein
VTLVLRTIDSHSKFREAIEQIQSDYIKEEGWSDSCFTKPWKHILEPEHEHLNLPAVAMRSVDRWQQKHGRPFPWHVWHDIRSSRNMHSSQVLTLTFFGALMGDSDSFSPLESCLRRIGLMGGREKVLDTDFEYEPPNFFGEKTRTSVDFSVEVGGRENRQRIHFEVKFLESTFGGCSTHAKGECDAFPGRGLDVIPKDCPLTSKGIRYWDALMPLLDQRSGERGCPIAGPSYQLARNLMHLITEGGRTFVVLIDGRALYLREEIRAFLEMLRKEFRPLVQPVGFQDLLPDVAYASPKTIPILMRKYGIWA